MKLGPLNHADAAPPWNDAAVARYCTLLGPEEVGEAFDPPVQKMHMWFVDVRNSQIELVEPLVKESSIAKFFEKNPAGAQHHPCFEVSDILAIEAELEGVKVFRESRTGAQNRPVVFGRPKGMSGVFTELIETTRGAH